MLQDFRSAAKELDDRLIPGHGKRGGLFTVFHVAPFPSFSRGTFSGSSTP
jgi:hypothetical protein